MHTVLSNTKALLNRTTRYIDENLTVTITRGPGSNSNEKALIGLS